MINTTNQFITSQYHSVLTNSLKLWLSCEIITRLKNLLAMQLVLLSLLVLCLKACPLDPARPAKQQDFILKSKDTALECFDKSLNNGWYELANQLLENHREHFQQQFITLLQAQKIRLEILKEDVILSSSECEPVLKWGQNQTYIFVTFKLSHRWDSPPCLNSLQEKANINATTFQYENICVVSQHKVRFHIKISLLNLIDPKSQPLVKKDGVGTYSILLQKASPQIWTYLDKQLSNYPIWRQISQRYSSYHESYSAAWQKESTKLKKIKQYQAKSSQL